MKPMCATLSAMKEFFQTTKAAKCFVLAVMMMLFLSKSSFAVCDASFTYSVSGNTIQFTNTSQSTYPAAFIWLFGDGDTSSAENPSHSYNSGGYYIVCLTLYDSLNCYDTFCDSVYVGNPACNAYFGYTVSGYDYYFSDYSNGSYTNVSWDFGDGTTSTDSNPSHVFPSIGYYFVCLTISDSSCSDTYCQYIYVPVDSNQQCNACFTVDIDSAATEFYDCSLSAGQIISWQCLSGMAPLRASKIPFTTTIQWGPSWSA